MPSLKEYRVRIDSVKSTQKITSAMKMVAAAKLRRAQEQAEAARPYAQRMERMLGSLAASVAGSPNAPALLAGNGKDHTHLVVVATADRGLCGAFNSSIARDSRRLIDSLLEEGKEVKVLCVGRKGRDQLRRTHGHLIVDTIEDVAKPRLTFDAADGIATRIRDMFEAGEFDVCTIIYNTFKSAISQIVTRQQLIPFVANDEEKKDDEAGEAATGSAAQYEFEPSDDAILSQLLPRNLAIQVFRALLENNASEQGARMAAMDSATRNAGDMISALTLEYNKQRQAAITGELIEIISGMEAL